jgi:hypothetical protein
MSSEYGNLFKVESVHRRKMQEIASQETASTYDQNSGWLFFPAWLTASATFTACLYYVARPGGLADWTYNQDNPAITGVATLVGIAGPTVATFTAGYIANKFGKFMAGRNTPSIDTIVDQKE